MSTEQLRRIGKELENQGLALRWAATARDARAVLRTESGLAAAVVAWDLPGDDGGDQEGGGADVLRLIQRRFKDLPVFLLMADESDHDLERLPLWVSEAVVGYIWPLEDTAAFIAGRVTAAARAYHRDVLPPFFKALRRFDDAHEYSWHTPAHSGGVAFLKSAAGGGSSTTTSASASSVATCVIHAAQGLAWRLPQDDHSCCSVWHT
ncbi:Orn/Lys/Arg decarboxylase N-terminal domain-containing protein [Kitasatospora sp. NPDC059648]|uniref:Orn/Lys/Arg decarboxylase N-terminal domain-containing protein n=1 Tax=Kitasatospora sp. NPDC059648 TaxID=3346894 RepID=UPI0036BF819D